jgi:hypothetical protein
LEKTDSVRVMRISESSAVMEFNRQREYLCTPTLGLCKTGMHENEDGFDKILRREMEGT